LIFEKKNVKEDKIKEKNYDFFLLGYNRIGFSVLRSFIKLRKSYGVVDFNPETIKTLSSRKINCIYGDVDDAEFLGEVKLNKSKLVVSTIPDLDTNLLLLKFIRAGNEKAIVILTARQINDALRLYKEGADYVILPHFLGGEYTSRIIEKASTNKEAYEVEREKQVKDLRERFKEGHEHPEVERN
ncbi:MAG: NAD(P)-binding protein, partial [Nanoarchaeota archaeon]